MRQIAGVPHILGLGSATSIFHKIIIICKLQPPFGNFLEIAQFG